MNHSILNHAYRFSKLLAVAISACVLMTTGCGDDASTGPETNSNGFSFQHDVLIIDDYKDWLEPSDGQHDEFWQDLAENSGKFASTDAIAFFNTFGPGDRGSELPQVALPQVLGNYKLLIISARGLGRDGQSGLSEMVVSGLLSRYVEAGGKVWIVGEATSVAMDPLVSGVGSFSYPKTFTQGSFPFDHLKLSSRVENGQEIDLAVNGLVSAIPTANVSLWPQLDLDAGKRSLSTRNQGLSWYDALVEDPTGTSGTGFLEALYRAQVSEPGASDFQDRIIATRWHDTSAEPSQGRVAWFGFPLYYMEDASAQDVFNQMIDWFNEGY